MNYLRSFDYIEDKNRLKDEFKEAFLTIEGYYIQEYTEDKYEVQFSLKQLLHDFLMAQESGKSLEMVAGPDIKDYAVKIIDTALKPKRSPLYWVSTVIGFVWLLLFIMLSHTLLSDSNKGYSFFEKLRHLYFYIYYVRDLALLIAVAYLFIYIHKRITKRLFYRPGQIKTLNIAFSLSIALFTTCYIKFVSPYGNELRLHMPLSISLILTLITTTYMIVVCIISYRKTKEKKRALIEYEEANIEQVTCPSCGHIHDIDYPKCPKCGFHNE